jgi:hypothetical protein
LHEAFSKQHRAAELPENPHAGVPVPSGRKVMSDATSTNPAGLTCGGCGSVLAYPTGSCLVETTKLWNISICCPECGWEGDTSCTHAEMMRLAGERERATAAIRTELERMERIHMREWVESFLHALDLDLFGPDDF